MMAHKGILALNNRVQKIIKTTRIMNSKKIIMTLAAILLTTGARAALKPKTIYVYGFAASFNDSTVYFTDIQQVDSAYIDSKTKFLYSRENYSYQLRDYLDNIGFKNATCTTSFATTKKEAEKKYLALRKRYLGGGNYNIHYLKESEFRFQPISGDIEIIK